jgi:acyl-CoA thioester hydrolase
MSNPAPDLSSSTSRVRVRYAETDQMGVVYYANYFVWFEVGRTDLLRAMGGTYRQLESDGVFLPVIEAACTYSRPSHYDEDLEIRTRGELLSPIRVRFAYEVTRQSDGVLTATGHTVHAAVNRDGRPCRLPEPVQRALRDAPTDGGRSVGSDRPEGRQPRHRARRDVAIARER